jgi:hypothetical protein
MTEPRNWDKELADIDRVIEKQGGAAPAERGSPALPAPQPRAPTAPLEGEARKGSVTRTWFWTVLALLLAVALPIWPYGKECGLQSFFYLGAVTLTLLAGLAGAVAAWGTRSGLAHILSLVVVLWSGAMGAREVLPRIGYAAQAKTWLCPSAPEPAPQPSPPAGEAQPAPSGTQLSS